MNARTIKALRAYPKLHLHYSGQESAEFWRRVNDVVEDNREEAYSLGVALQTCEEAVLKRLKQLGVT